MILVTATVSMLMAQHELALPASNPQATTQAVTAPSTQWISIHILAVGCPCSKAVENYLCERHRQNDLTEYFELRPLCSDADVAGMQSQLVFAGFEPVSADLKQLVTTMDIPGGPWLILIDPNGHVRYSGGYADRNPGLGVTIQDLKILSRLQQGQTTETYPAFGCATKRQIQRATDPLGLKYGQ